MEGINMTYVMVERDHPIMDIKLEGVSPDLDREELVKNLAETMRQENGIGLSANQVGILERVFIMYSDLKERKIISCFNPQIIEESIEQSLADEGCLTYPGLWLKVKRPVWIKATWEDSQGTEGEYELAGLEARIFQHEYDHMEGTNFTKKVSKLRMTRALKRLEKQTKKINRMT
jgi:peptide deformylase